MNRILVTPRSLTATPHPAVKALREQGFDIVYSTPGKLPDEEELIKLVPDITGWLAGVEPISADVLRAAGRLRVISRNGAGVDNVPMDVAEENGIVVRRASGANAAGVAELTIALMLASLRRIPLADAGIKAGEWPRKRGYEIRGRTVGVIGCGAIGAEVARLAAALGASILAFDPQRPNIDISSSQFAWAEIPEILERSFVISLHCPSPADGKPLVDADMLARMQKGAFLVNTARGALIDEDAVMAALDSGHLAGYATDVYVQEPPKSLALFSRPDVIATSHIGGFTDESVDRATEIAVFNLLESLRQ